MSDRGLRSCLLKVAYPSQEAAARRLERMSAAIRRSKQVYRCSHCGLLHIGTQAGTLAKAQAAYKARRARR